MIATAVYARQQPQYEVATVKLSLPVPLGTLLPINLGSVNNGTATLTNVTLSECLQFAYGIVSEIPEKRGHGKTGATDLLINYLYSLVGPRSN
jgi:hypothetical protein